MIHTNLGRAPIDPSIWSEAGEIARGYSNLEFDLEAGERGARDNHLSRLCRSLFDCEAAILTNNNAAAVTLLLAAVASGREVVVSRGELVEIGGGFRVPDVIQQGGAKLREVGTTNRTRAGDYADALTRRTAAMLRVHRSNFDIVGFTETPSIAELVEISRTRRVPLLYDEGAGRVVDLQPYGFSHEPSIADLIAAGVDALTCSTDKLVGATQGGLILGRAEIIDHCRMFPMMRAVRAGKETYGVVAATLRAFATGKHEKQIAIYRMMSLSMQELKARAEAIVAGSSCEIVPSRAAAGGGTTPNETIDSLAVAVPGNAVEMQRRFLNNDPPIVGRIQEGRFTIDVRTLLDDDLEAVRNALVS
jgi:L-seryl-tRNA(Ser) seleniumtransferase